MTLKTYLVQIFIFFASSISVYAGNFVETYGISARGISMGNAMTSIVDDWSSVFYNVAGLGKTEHLKSQDGRVLDESSMTLLKVKDNSNNKDFFPNQLSIGYFHTLPFVNIDIAKKVYGDRELDFGYMVIGVAVDLNIIFKMPKWLSSARFGLGLGTMFPDGMAKINDLDARAHTFMRYGRNVQMIKILGGLGLGFLKDVFGVGIGVTLGVSGEGEILVSDIDLTSDYSQTPLGQTKLDQKLSAFFNAGVYISPGQALSILKGLQLGASFRQENYLEIYPVRNNAVMNVGGMNMALELSMYGFYTPHIVTAGISYSFWRMTLSADLDCQLWSLYQYSDTRKKVHRAMEDQAILNGATAEEAAQYRLPDFEDIYVPKFGMKIDANKYVSVMLGYQYQMSFISDDALKTYINYLDNDKHIGSLGMEFYIPKMWRIGGPITITIGYQLQYLVERQVTKNAEAAEPYNPDYTFGGLNHTVYGEISIKL